MKNLKNLGTATLKALVSFQLIFMGPAMAQYTSGHGRQVDTESYYDQGALNSLYSAAVKMSAEEMKDPQVQRNVERLVVGIDNLFDAKAYPSEIKDIGNLSHQSVYIHNEKREIHLDRPEALSEVPELIWDINSKNFTVTLDPENNRFMMNYFLKDIKTGQEFSLSHVFNGYQPIAYNFDGEVFAVLDRSGIIYVASTVLIDFSGFRMPIAFVPVVQLNSTALDTVIDAQRQGEKVELEFLTRGTSEFSRLDGGYFPDYSVYSEKEKVAFEASTMAVFVGSENQKLSVSEFERERVQSILGLGLTAIAQQLEVLVSNSDIQKGDAPGSGQTKLADIVKLTPQDEAKIEKHMNAAFIPDALRQMIDKSFLPALANEAMNNLFLGQNPPEKDVILESDRASDLALIQESQTKQLEEQERLKQRLENSRAKDKNIEELPYTSVEDSEALKDSAENWQSHLLRKQNVEKTFWQKYKMGIFLLAGVATYGFIDYGTYLFQMGKEPAWATYLIGTYFDVTQEVLLEVNYKWDLAKAFLVIGVGLMGLSFVGGIFGKKYNHSGKKMVLTFCKNFTAYILYPLGKAFANFTGQKTFVEMAGLGLNPLAKVPAESKVGKAIGLKEDMYPGLNVPFLNTKKEQAKHQQKVQAIKSINHMRGRQKLGAYAIGALLAESYLANNSLEVDLAELSNSLKKGAVGLSADQQLGMPFIKKKDYKEFLKNESNYSTEEAQKIKESVKFLDVWVSLSQYIYMNVEKNSDFGLHSFAEMNVEETRRMIEVGQAYGDQFFKKNRSALRSVKVNQYVNRFLTNGIGAGAHNSTFFFLKNVELSDRVVQEIWTPFVNDFIFGAVVDNVLSTRANFADSTYLAADITNPIKILKEQNVTNLEQLGVLLLTEATNTILTFQKGVPPRVFDFEDQERFDRHGPQRVTKYSPVENNIFDGRRNNEGYFHTMFNWFKHASDLRKAQYPTLFFNIQKNRLKAWRLEIVVGLTVLMTSGMGLSSSAMLLVYLMSMGIFLYKWVWKVNAQGNMLMLEQLERDNEKLREAKHLISRGARLGRYDLIERGYLMLSELYKPDGDLPKQLDRKDQKYVGSELKGLNKKLGLDKEEFNYFVKGLHGRIGLIFDLAQEHKRLLAEKKQAEGSLWSRVKSNPFKVVKGFFSKKEKLESDRLQEIRNKILDFGHTPEAWATFAPKDPQEAVATLEASLNNPPVARDINRRYHSQVIYVWSLVTTLIYTAMMSEGLDREGSKFQLMVEGLTMSATIFLVLFAAQYGIDKVAGPQWDKIKAKLRQKRSERQQKVVESIQTRLGTGKASCQMLFKAGG